MGAAQSWYPTAEALTERVEEVAGELHVDLGEKDVERLFTSLQSFFTHHEKFHSAWTAERSQTGLALYYVARAFEEFQVAVTERYALRIDALRDLARALGDCLLAARDRENALDAYRNARAAIAEFLTPHVGLAAEVQERVERDPRSSRPTLRVALARPDECFLVSHGLIKPFLVSFDELIREEYERKALVEAYVREIKNLLKRNTSDKPVVAFAHKGLGPCGAVAIAPDIMKDLPKLGRILMRLDTLTREPQLLPNQPRQRLRRQNAVIAYDLNFTGGAIKGMTSLLASLNASCSGSVILYNAQRGKKAKIRTIFDSKQIEEFAAERRMRQRSKHSGSFRSINGKKIKSLATTEQTLKGFVHEMHGMLDELRKELRGRRSDENLGLPREPGEESVHYFRKEIPNEDIGEIIDEYELQEYDPRCFALLGLSSQQEKLAEPYLRQKSYQFAYVGEAGVLVPLDIVDELTKRFGGSRIILDTGDFEWPPAREVETKRSADQETFRVRRTVEKK